MKSNGIILLKGKGIESLKSLTVRMKKLNELDARAFVMDFFEEKILDTFCKIHIEDLASMTAAFEIFTISLKDVLEHHPEEKQAYEQMMKKVSLETIYVDHTRQEDKENGI